MKIFQNYTKVSANNLNPVYTALQLLLPILLLMWLACSKPTDPPEPTPITVATLTTATVNTIAQTTAQSGGNITADGGSAITARGVIWSTTASPTIADSKTIDGTGKGNFSSSITGLAPYTTYYARAYATNSIGTAYGNEVSFTTEEESMSLIGKWNVESTKIKSYQNSQLVEDVSLPGGAIFDFQSNGNVVMTHDGVIESHPYTIFPDSTVQIEEDVLEIRNLTDSSVTLYQRADYSPDEYAEYILSLKK